MVLRLNRPAESPGGCFNTRVAGTQPRRFWFTRSGAETGHWCSWSLGDDAEATDLGTTFCELPLQEEIFYACGLDHDETGVLSSTTFYSFLHNFPVFWEKRVFYLPLKWNLSLLFSWTFSEAKADSRSPDMASRQEDDIGVTHRLLLLPWLYILPPFSYLSVFSIMVTANLWLLSRCPLHCHRLSQIWKLGAFPPPAAHRPNPYLLANLFILHRWLESSSWVTLKNSEKKKTIWQWFFSLGYFPLCVFFPKYCFLYS